jgi:hypothetical protein
MPKQLLQGQIAILDALGAATYTESEIDRFLESRELVLEKLNKRAEAGVIDKTRLNIFTFNDTVVIVYRSMNNVTLNDIDTFAVRLRAFMMHSFENDILFRGSISIGEFRSVDDKSNTVLGPAVSDAAAWYDKADWIGIAATPHATIYIQSLLERTASPKKLDHILVDYDVPLKGKGSDKRTTAKLKAVNWPKGFYVKGLRTDTTVSARSFFLSYLSRHRVPLGTESKYTNSLDFFDAIRKQQGLGVGEHGPNHVMDPPSRLKS